MTQEKSIDAQTIRTAIFKVYESVSTYANLMDDFVPGHKGKIFQASHGHLSLGKTLQLGSSFEKKLKNTKSSSWAKDFLFPDVKDTELATQPWRFLVYADIWLSTWQDAHRTAVNDAKNALRARSNVKDNDLLNDLKTFLDASQAALDECAIALGVIRESKIIDQLLEATRKSFASKVTAEETEGLKTQQRDATKALSQAQADEQSLQERLVKVKKTPGKVDKIVTAFLENLEDVAKTLGYKTDQDNDALTKFLDDAGLAPVLLTDFAAASRAKATEKAAELEDDFKKSQDSGRKLKQASDEVSRALSAAEGNQKQAKRMSAYYETFRGEKQPYYTNGLHVHPLEGLFNFLTNDLSGALAKVVTTIEKSGNLLAKDKKVPAPS